MTDRRNLELVPLSSATGRLTARPYQTKAIQAALAHLLGRRLGAGRFGMIVLPPGAGKTFVANQAVAKLVASGKRVL